MNRELFLRALERPTPDPLERVHVARCLDLAQSWPRCLDSDHYTPGHFTASAFVLSPEDDAVLMIHHAKLQRWLQPGGHVEPGDGSFEQAMRREVLEETGLGELDRLTPENELFDVDVHEIPARKDKPAHDHHDVRLLFRARSRQARALDGVEAARFVPLEELCASVDSASLIRPLRKILVALQRGDAATG